MHIPALPWPGPGLFLAALLAAQLSIAAMAGAAEPAVHQGGEEVANLEPNGQESIWQLNDEWQIVVFHECWSREEKFGFWPADAECEGKLQITYTPPLSQELAERYRGLYTKVRNDLLSIAGTPEKDAQRLYQLMLEQKDPLLGIQDVTVRLQSFKERTAQDLRKSSKEAADQMQAARSELRMMIAGTAFGCLAAGFLLWFAYRWIQRVLPTVMRGAKSLADTGADKAKDALGGLREMHTRHVVRDETIRAATRSSLDQTRDERAALHDQLQRALDDGNVELARTLTSVLRTLEGDRTDR